MSSTLLTAAIVLGALFIFILLFVWMHKKEHNKKVAKKKIIFADIAWKNKLEISEKESINNCELAIDRTNFILLYINFSTPKEEVTLVDLWQIKTVKVATEENSVYEYRKGKSILVDKQVINLHLEITFAENDKPTLQLPLHQYKDGMHDFVLIKSRANYWSEMINDCVRGLPHTKKQSVTKV